MTKKKTSKSQPQTKVPEPTQAMTRNRYGWCEEEILREIVGPKISYILSNCGPVESKAHLLTLMQDIYSDTISASSLSYWCDKLGFVFKKVMVVEQQGVPIPSDQTVELASDDLGDAFDNEQRGEINPRFMPQVGGLSS